VKHLILLVISSIALAKDPTWLPQKFPVNDFQMPSHKKATITYIDLEGNKQTVLLDKAVNRVKFKGSYIELVYNNGDKQTFNKQDKSPAILFRDNDGIKNSEALIFADPPLADFKITAKTKKQFEELNELLDKPASEIHSHFEIFEDSGLPANPDKIEEDKITFIFDKDENGNDIYAGFQGEVGIAHGNSFCTGSSYKNSPFTDKRIIYNNCKCFIKIDDKVYDATGSGLRQDDSFAGMIVSHEARSNCLNNLYYSLKDRGVDISSVSKNIAEEKIAQDEIQTEVIEPVDAKTNQQPLIFNPMDEKLAAEMGEIGEFSNSTNILDINTDATPWDFSEYASEEDMFGDIISKVEDTVLDDQMIDPNTGFLKDDPFERKPSSEEDNTPEVIELPAEEEIEIDEDELNESIDKIVEENLQKEEIVPEVIESPTPGLPKEEIEQLAEEIEEVVVIEEDKEQELVDEIDCKDRLTQEIKRIVENDKDNNILGKQYHLTVLKTALMISEKENKGTWEDYVRKNQARINNEQTLKDVKAAYKKYGGESADYEQIKQKFTQADYYWKYKQGDESYRAPHKRLYNEDSSAFILAHQLGDQNSPYSKIDSAIVWFMDEATKAAGQKYTAKSNSTNFSSLVAWYTSNQIEGTPELSTAQINNQLTEAQKQFDGLKDIVTEQFSEEFKLACYKTSDGVDFIGTCEWNTALLSDSLSDALMDVNEKIQADNDFSLALSDDLIGTMGGKGTFDLSMFRRPKEVKREMASVAKAGMTNDEAKKIVFDYVTSKNNIAKQNHDGINKQLDSFDEQYNIARATAIKENKLYFMVEGDIYAKKSGFKVTKESQKAGVQEVRDIMCITEGNCI
jgi:hypothetical protein